MRLLGPLVVEAPKSSVRAVGLGIRWNLEEGVHLERGGVFYFVRIKATLSRKELQF